MHFNTHKYIHNHGHLKEPRAHARTQAQRKLFKHAVIKQVSITWLNGFSIVHGHNLLVFYY